MKSNPIDNSKQTRAGFTLLELISAMIILTIAMGIAFQAFSGTIRGWKRGTDVLEGLQHGEFSMSQVAAALNSTIFFNNSRGVYDFKLEKDTIGGLPADSLSFVTGASALMSEVSPLQNTPHRIDLFIADDDDGDPALFSRSYPAVKNAEDAIEEYQPEPYLVSRAVHGLEVLLYDKEREDWLDEEWTRRNALPERIRVTLFVASNDEDEEPIAFSRIIDIPVFDSAKKGLTSPTTVKK